jgi:hypothetical protein
MSRTYHAQPDPRQDYVVTVLDLGHKGSVTIHTYPGSSLARVSSTFDRTGEPRVDGGLDMLETLLLTLSREGVDVGTPRYERAVASAIDAFFSQHGE